LSVFDILASIAPRIHYVQPFSSSIPNCATKNRQATARMKSTTFASSTIYIETWAAQVEELPETADENITSPSPFVSRREAACWYRQWRRNLGHTADLGVRILDETSCNDVRT
jgi:hypothetical protein